MKKGDIIIVLTTLLFLFLMLSPWTSDGYIYISHHFRYTIGFIKFAVFATIGELLALRITNKRYVKPPYLLARIIIWGIVGVMIVFSFALYEDGVAGILNRGLLPNWDVAAYKAFLIAATMNLTFGPVFMGAHRISDAYLNNLAIGKKGIRAAVERVDWNSFLTFVVGKTIPLFWIPAHTITFLLPAEYRVFVAAILSIALGLILAFASLKKREQ